MMLNDYHKNNGWWTAVVLSAVVTFMIMMFMTGCKTNTLLEKEFVHDTLVTVDTVITKSIEVRYDTTYVHDSYTEKYYIGNIDTVYNIRVDTVKVSTVQYIYREHATGKADSVALSKANIQKSTTAKESVTEKPEQGKGADWYVRMILWIIILLVVLVTVWYAGRWIDKQKK